MPCITKRFVDGLVPGPKEFEYWDDQFPGFGIRVKPSGVKTYVIRYSTPSGQRRLKLGLNGKLTPEQARTLTGTSEPAIGSPEPEAETPELTVGSSGR